MTSRRIRIRHSKGSSTLTVSAEATNEEVAKEIAKTTLIPVEEQVWKGGFPPKPQLGLNGQDVAVKDLDLIHVSQGTPGSITIVKQPQSLAMSEELDAPPLVDPDGYAIRRVMDADNSCLFRSISYAMYHNRSQAEELRQLVAQTIRNDLSTYNDAFLGQANADYASWISKTSTWGGQIELSILSTQLQVEIVAFDVVRNRHDIYGTSNTNSSAPKTRRRIMVLYDGIHYDAVAYCLDPSLPEDMDTTIFHVDDHVVVERAQVLCQQQHAAKQFTDTSQFTLRCLVCQQGLKGQAEAAEHAKQTMHTNFAEYH